MAKRIEYQQGVGVPPASGASSWKERILLDKWAPQFPDMTTSLGRWAGRIGLSVAIMAGLAAVVVPPASGSSSWVETTKLDKWTPRFVDRHYYQPTLPTAITSASGAVIVPPASGSSSWKEAVRLDKFEPIFPDTTQKLPGLSPAIQAGQAVGPVAPVAAVAQVYESSWQPVSPDYIPPPAKLSPAIQAGQPVGLATNTFPETILADKWAPQFPDQILRPRTLPTAEHQSVIDTPRVETVLSDKWAPVFPDILLYRPPISPAIQAGSVFHTLFPIYQAETVLADKWAPVFVDRINLPPTLSPAIQAGSAILVPPVDPAGDWLERILADKWQPVAPDMILSAVKISPAIQSGSFTKGFDPSEMIPTVTPPPVIQGPPAVSLGADGYQSLDDFLFFLHHQIQELKAQEREARRLANREKKRLAAEKRLEELEHAEERQYLARIRELNKKADQLHTRIMEIKVQVARAEKRRKDEDDEAGELMATGLL